MHIPQKILNMIPNYRFWFNHVVAALWFLWDESTQLLSINFVYLILKIIFIGSLASIAFFFLRKEKIWELTTSSGERREISESELVQLIKYKEIEQNTTLYSQSENRYFKVEDALQISTLIIEEEEKQKQQAKTDEKIASWLFSIFILCAIAAIGHNQNLSSDEYIDYCDRAYCQ